MFRSFRLRSAGCIAIGVTLAAICSGCGGSLADTSWTVAEITGKTDADQAAIADVKSIFVEFSRDGRLRTSVTRTDGRVDREDDETYQYNGDSIVIRHPNYERRLNVTLTGNTMQVTSDRFNATLERYVPPASDQPAMFRPSSVGRVEYRTMSQTRGAAGRR